jgi:multiple sugar transport system permease protein
MKSRKNLRWVAYLVVFLGLVWTLLPLYWMVITSVKPTDEVFAADPTFYPHSISTEGIEEAWTYGGARGLRHSSIVALGTLVVSLLLGVPAAYAISRFRTGGGELPFIILSFRFMPPIAPAVGFWVMATSIGIYDTHLVLILVNSMASIPFVVWIMKGFIDEIPYGIEEAAQVDGANWLRVVRDHILPLAAPGLVAVSLFVIIFTWNEFLFATLLTGRYVLPFPKAVPGMTIGVFEPHWGAVMAMGMMVVIPIALLAFYMQKYIVRGMSYGAIRE